VATVERCIPWAIVLTDSTPGILDLQPLGVTAGSALDIAHAELPAPLRSGALGVLDISEFFGETTGGVRTYLLEKARYVQQDPTLRQVLVVPGAADEILESSGVRCYRLRGAPIPTQKPYRFMLATRSWNHRAYAVIGSVEHRSRRRSHIGSCWRRDPPAESWLMSAPM
jgi:hypothetical protein